MTPPDTIAADQTFRVRFWGVRGSYPTTDAQTRRVGGNTACVEVIAGGRRFIFDAGTGIIALGRSLSGNSVSVPVSYIFLSHTHLDHILGLSFFEPLLTTHRHTYIFGPHADGKSLAHQLQLLTRTSLFPVALDELKGEKEIHSLNGGELLRFEAGSDRPRIGRYNAANSLLGDGPTIATHKSAAHPRDGVMLYRVNYLGKSLVYATDIEQKGGGFPEVIEFARGADLLIHDAQYLHGEYFAKKKSKKGWGHSTIEMAATVAKKAQVKRLVLFHHEPLHDDVAMQAIERQAKRLFPGAVTARENGQIKL
ncbi:MAG TPA: MBL fold metallo-hydrolase [Acidobacteriota bacterium]|nr:MBL fold metallo-hydrolase [Acidobacteriota bacterium]